MASVNLLEQNMQMVMIRPSSSCLQLFSKYAARFGSGMTRLAFSGELEDEEEVAFGVTYEIEGDEGCNIPPDLVRVPGNGGMESERCNTML